MTSQQITYSGQFKLYEIEDGETHRVAAVSSKQAVEFYAKLYGYTAEEYAQQYEDVVVNPVDPHAPIAVFDYENSDAVEVKTAAEWADVTEPTLISSTAY